VNLENEMSTTNEQQATVLLGAFLGGKLVISTRVPDTPESIETGKRILQDSYGPDAKVMRKIEGR
jgi:hypothetical protein